MKALILIVISINVAHAQNYIQKYVNDFESKKNEISLVIGQAPYQNKEHEVIKNYFAALNKFIDEQKEYSWGQQQFNNYIESIGAEQFCSKSFLSQDEWKLLVKNCTRNRFFLCSEDVRNFAATKSKMTGYLSEELRDVFQNAQSCQ